MATYSYSVASGVGVYAGRQNPLPLWRRGKTVGAWFELSGLALSSFSNATRGLVSQGVRNDYAGYFVDPVSSLAIARGGGHAGSSDNGVYAINLALDTPAFAVVCEPSPSGEAVSGAVWFGTAPNQKPNATHTYDSGIYCATLGSYLWFRQRSPWNYSGTPAGGDIIMRLTKATGAWVQPGAVGDLGSDGGMTTAVCQDADGNIYGVSGAQTIHKFNPLTGGISLFVNNALLSSNTYGQLIYDPVRNRLIRIGDLSNDLFVTISLDATPVVADFEASLNGASGDIAGLKACLDNGDACAGACYDQWNDRLIVMDGVAGNYYTINLTTWAVAYVTPSGAVPNKGSLASTVCVKPVPALGGLLYWYSGSANPWFLPLI